MNYVHPDNVACLADNTNYIACYGPVIMCCKDNLNIKCQELRIFIATSLPKIHPEGKTLDGQICS